MASVRGALLCCGLYKSPLPYLYNDAAAHARPDSLMPATTVNREDELIERIRRRMPSLAGGLLRAGIGDDAAVFRPTPGTDWILTCDQFIDGVHFLADVHPPEVVGHKALARATSDIAAMGGRPRLFLLSMTLPVNRTGRWLDQVLAGMARAAHRFGLMLAGGDTARQASSSLQTPAGQAAFSVTVLGELKARHAVLRSGARPGDTVFVTGRLGAAQLGLELVLRRMHRQKRWRRLLMPHYYPKIHIDLGQWLARRRLVSAMMDLSDGLSTDLDRLCRASGAGARIHEQKIPCVAVPSALRAQFDSLKIKSGSPKTKFDSLRVSLDPLALALHGGEDYGLLFTAPRRSLSRIPRALFGTRITPIGEIVRGRGVQLVAANGRAALLEPRGWDHFRPSR
jgi:thiamine-monophosphate kinase